MGDYVLIARGTEESRIVRADFSESQTAKVLCPWHREATPSCCMSLLRGIFYCFGCQTSGKWRRAGETEEEALIQEYKGLVAQDLLCHPDNRMTNKQWWNAYRQYLASNIWREKRWRVMERAGRICEGCGTERATQVHHLTYKRVGREMLFDLVAICDGCHEVVHEDKERPHA